MARNDIYIERRPDDTYAVRKPNAQRASIVTDTQRQAIQWAKQRGYNPDVERVRHTGRGNPDKWRSGK
jgi:hypothetical protein